MPVVIKDCAVYVHFPFCKSRCIYCDFVTNVTPLLPVQAVTAKVIQELALRREWANISGAPLSVYLGGGTPSIWPADALGEIIAACLNGGTSSEIEVTVELNPGDVDPRWVTAVMAAGANRFSLGIQSMNDARLQWLGRRHSVNDAIDAVRVMRQCHVTNVSVDFIYATPFQKKSDLADELHALCALDVDHVSAYELSVAEGTPLHKMKLPVMSEEEREVLWQSTGEILHQYGLARYEVSNYAKEGKFSRHNSHYWRGGPYLGIGCGAHGFVTRNGRRIRYSNGVTLQRWLSDPISLNRISRDVAVGDGFFEELTDLDFARELVMLGLRCESGIDALQLAPLIETHPTFGNALMELQDEGWLTFHNHRYLPSKKAILLADELALRFF